MNIRNARYNRFGTIDCEIEHSDLGWIPFTASPNDNEKAGRAIYDEVMTSGTEIAAHSEPITDLAAVAMARINAGYAAALKAILDQYPRDETLSFDKQEYQADAWWAWYDPDGNDQAGTEPATPYLDSMLITRPIGKAELVNRIRDKAARFSDAHGQATGKRQALEDEVKTALEAEDREKLEGLDW